MVAEGPDHMSSVNDNKRIVRTLIEEIFNLKDLSTLANFIATDHILYGLSDMPLKRYYVAKKITETFLVAFPDMAVTVEDLIAEEDRVALRYNWIGTQRGVFAINPPKILIQPVAPKFQSKIKVTGTNIYRINNSSRRISETHVQMDLLALYRQLGMIELLDEKSVGRSAGRGAYVGEG